MTFRDYSQGAYRMRGIGKGQTIHITPGIHPLYTLYYHIYTYVHPLYMYLHHIYT